MWPPEARSGGKVGGKPAGLGKRAGRVWRVRKKALLGAALVIAATAVAQETPEEQFKRNADALDKFDLKQDVEPAFAFKA